MNLTQYIQAINDQKKKAQQRFFNLTTFQRQMFDAAYGFMIDNIDISGGRFEIPEDLPALMDQFVTEVVDVAEKSKQYQSSLTGFIADLNVIKNNLIDFHGDFNKIKIKNTINPIQKVVIEEVINQYTANGLNKHFAAPLRDLMFGNILAGISQKDARRYLQDYIIGGEDQSGKLGRYLEQTAIQGVDSYAGAINMKVADEFKFTGFIISGSLIATSSKQCIYAVENSDGGYLPFEQWKKVLKMAEENPKARLIEGTTLKNLPLNKLHWGCRHEFTPTNK